VLYERPLDMALLGVFLQSEENENVWPLSGMALERVEHKIGLRRRQPVGEIRNGIAGMRMGGRLDLHGPPKAAHLALGN
jgi:hypothetical protein